MTDPGQVIALCEEYGHSVKGYNADEDAFVVSLILDAKYFRELFDRMKELGYTCAVARRLSKKHHRVTFSPTNNHEEDGFDNSCIA